jgi:hypothetical protein
VHGTTQRSLPGGLAAAVVVVVGSIGGQACGSDDPAVPTAEALATRLVDVDTYPGQWTVNVPEDNPEAASGVVTDELRPLLPRLDLCDRADAESRAAAAKLRWTAFRQIDLTVDDPIDPPTDPTGHLIFVQELVTVATPVEIEATFDVLRGGMDACLGDVPAGEEGSGVAAPMALPEVGDDRVGVLLTMEEAGGGAQWRLHTALVRDGAALVSVVVADIVAGVEPYYTTDDVARMIATAVDLL